MIQPSWYFFLPALLIGSAAALLFLWALAGDKARGRARCPCCWYSLAGSIPDPDGLITCAECGRSGIKDRDMRRPRRRWRLAAIALLVLLAMPFLAIAPEVRAHGWMSVIPNRILFAAIPIGGYDGFFGLELQCRIGVKPWPNQSYASTLLPHDRDTLLFRIADGTFVARPGSRLWRESYGELLQERSWYSLADEYSGDPRTGERTYIRRHNKAVNAVRQLPSGFLP